MPNDQGSTNRPLMHPAPASTGGEPVSAFTSDKPTIRTNARYRSFAEEEERIHPSHQEPGLLRRLLNCRCLGCGCLLLLLAVTALGAYIIIQRPPGVWDPIKLWLNAGLEQVDTGSMTAATAFAHLNSQVNSFGVGVNTIVISEKELQAILRFKLSTNNLADLNVDIEPDSLKLYWNIDAPRTPPLWMVVNLKTENDTSIVFSMMGTERIPLPAFLNSLATQLTSTFLKYGEGKSVGTNLLDVVFTAPSNVTIQKVQLEKDQLRLTINIKNGLDNIFGN